MFIYIPGELIALITFPGVIFHEVAHRFFCDIYDVQVYNVNYFRILSKRAGHVIYKPTQNFKHKFFIATGPLIINSLVCMLLTFPSASKAYLGTSFIDYSSPLLVLAHIIMTWIGYSVGFHSIPSNQDMKDLMPLVQSKIAKIVLYIFIKIIALFNFKIIGFFLTFGYMVLISRFLPYLFLS